MNPDYQAQIEVEVTAIDIVNNIDKFTGKELRFMLEAINNTLAEDPDPRGAGWGTFGNSINKTAFYWLSHIVEAFKIEKYCLIPSTLNEEIAIESTLNNLRKEFGRVDDPTFTVG